MVGRKADGGVNYMILFIATVIVAGVAATVLLQTSNSLQSQSLETGKKTQETLTSMLEIVDVYAQDGSSGKSVREFYMTIRVAPGSRGIKLRGSHIEGDFDSGSFNTEAIPYNETARNCTIGTSELDSAFWTNPTTERGNFSYMYLKKGNSWTDGYLLNGDLVQICVQAPYDIGEDKPVVLRIVPSEGIVRTIETATPPVINTKQLHLYP
jgi:archaellin